MDVLKKMTLLYAEDEATTLKLHAEYFTNYFGAVYTADNGKQALEVYNNKKPDVVVLDINMPIVNGIDVSKSIRKDDKLTQIILLTARVDTQTLIDAVELGLTTYLEKPVTSTPMIAALNKIASIFNERLVVKLWRYNDQYFVWDKSKTELMHGESLIKLTKNEKKLLEILTNSKHRNVTDQQIFNAIWSDEKEYCENTIKTIINSLRGKLPPNAIKNTYGIGYYLNKSF
ncbi:MAG: response regulator transcription factor [Gammaproteobacteria bacterium]|nr:response regulator transcription factor [Gammaproteobacteria bacterium]